VKLLFIGGINRGNLPRGGEEYKNQLLISKISNSSFRFNIIDTYQWQKKPSTWFILIYHILVSNWDSILISASSVSTYRLLKFIELIRPSLKPKTTYLVIGGYFPEGVRDQRFDWRIYRDLKNIIVEGEILKRNLQMHSDLENIAVVPNFKNFPMQLRIEKKQFTKVKFVFVGRISRGKGIKEILEAAEILKIANSSFDIDLYGPMEEPFELETDKSKYCGFLDFQNNPEKAYSKLLEYDCMLFPTYWKGEGFPGVIIDAFIAGLPVIATDWNMNTEIIVEGVNGFIVEPKSAEALAEMMRYVMDNRELLKRISHNNFDCAGKYHVDLNWNKIINLLEVGNR
jgi:glycosyltransferase involved in cell wall biosynthesis